ncbi:hypothetical protein RAB80_016161 [Fusarium oxysporum f. sp. vasinfectum]|uniref:Uncharacterized protein n=2 Tax=Fusarium oxysporum TaxID=5507 RepID=X0LK68_FUSOX|nr:hypothetical protein FOTG_10512 [Fusarium oxysporum f. sp. vasinfectum 25433]KAK2668781.1 hypothetical protein RAB80_016161 [Fusarium oxysporum f. sp. vasinfectum]KAK2925578.1 hypothetical protein FoTM2_013944 [Fusarium oxysporum f. sp. vasinfectum]TVY60140.1 hypothetical protein Focb16_v003378 [Fusarium oxysporum f. sp. cubense]
MCTIYSTPKTCGNCEAEDIVFTNTETCDAVKEGKACLGRNEIVINNAWLCPACKVNTARGPSYMEPYDYQPKIRQQASKKETGSFADKVKKMIGKK